LNTEHLLTETTMEDDYWELKFYDAKHALEKIDEDIRFVQRVLESDAPKEDREKAHKIVLQIRRTIREELS
jgi:hypothetical protein